MKRKIKSALLCVGLTLVSLAVMRYGNDTGHLPAADYTNSAEAVFFMFDENDTTLSAISYASANNILTLLSEEKQAVQVQEELSYIESSALRVLPPVVTPPETELEVFGAES